VRHRRLDEHGNIKTLTFTPEHSKTPITIECVTQNTLKTRADTVWVYLPGGCEVYQGPLPFDWQFNLGNYQHTRDKHGNIKKLTFIPENSQTPITIERISKVVYHKRVAPKKHPETVWVFPKGTSFVYQGPLPLDLESNPEAYKHTRDKHGNIKTLTFTPEHSKTPITIECVTQNTLKTRADTVWVYLPGGCEVYQGPLPLDLESNPEAYKHTRDKHGNIKTLTFTPQGSEKEITIEIVTKNVLRGRKYKGTKNPPEDHSYLKKQKHEHEHEQGNLTPANNETIQEQKPFSFGDEAYSPISFFGDIEEREQAEPTYPFGQIHLLQK
jgi:hypothetical protein